MKKNIKKALHQGEIPVGWNYGRIHELIDGLESGVSVNGEDRAPNDDEPAVLKVSSVTYGVFNQRASKPIIDGELERAKCHPKAGQIIISRASGTASHVGACAFIDRDYPNRYLPDKLWQTAPKADCKVSNKWLFYVLSSPQIKAKILNRATGTNIKNITKDELLSLKIAIPPFHEQIAIAHALTTWDEGIKTTEHLIAAKTKHYQYLVARLVNETSYPHGHVRDFTNEVSIRNGITQCERVLSVTNTSGFVLPEDQFERRVASADLSNYKIVEHGQYAYNPSRINVGSIARLDNWDEGVLSPMYVVFKLDTEKVNSDFFLHWLSSYEARQRIKRSAQGSVRETVSFADLGAIPFPLPDMDIQSSVIEVLNTAKREIDLLKQLTEQYRKQKRGLMQKLLTGEWRVNTDKEVA